MITSHKTFDYNGRALVEKISILAPFRYEAFFKNTGCFIYFKENAPSLLSSQVNTQLKANEAVLLKCGNHFLDLLKRADGDHLEVIVFHLFPDVLKRLYTGDLPEIIEKHKGNRSSQVIASSDVIAKFVDSLEFYFQHPSLVNNDLLDLKIKELILLLVQSKNIDSLIELIADLHISSSVHIREVIELHLFSNLNLSDLARLCNLSVSSFKRKFTKEYNDSPTSYINSRRVLKAQELLISTKLSISEIAYKVGFHDSLYFTRLFKKKIGIPPTIYRKENTR